MVISAKSQALARELLLAVTNHSTAGVRARPTALRRQRSSSCSRSQRQNDDAYSATIIDEGDRKLFSAMREARDRFVAAYRNASADAVLTDAELRTQLRPPLEEYVKLSDSLFDLNRNQGVGATTTITGSADRSLWMLGPALLLAIVHCRGLLLGSRRGSLAAHRAGAEVRRAGEQLGHGDCRHLEAAAGDGDRDRGDDGRSGGDRLADLGHVEGAGAHDGRAVGGGGPDLDAWRRGARAGSSAWSRRWGRSAPPRTSSTRAWRC